MQKAPCFVLIGHHSAPDLKRAAMLGARLSAQSEQQATGGFFLRKRNRVVCARLQKYLYCPMGPSLTHALIQEAYCSQGLTFEKMSPGAVCHS